jgi:pyrimidine-specific ribonucleoside hydrolase
VPRPLVIDTDPGIDDAVAILLALASPEVDLRLVTTVHGNVELAQTTENARRVLHLAGRSDVPVAAGARSALVHPMPERAGHVHGSAGLGGVELPPSPVPLDPRPAVVALAEELLASPEPVTVAAIGPLTNLALLLAVFPDAAARIDRLVLMGGSAGRGQTLVDRRAVSDAPSAVEVAETVDGEAAVAFLVERLCTLDRG